MRIGRHLIADGNRNLLLGGSIAVTCPVRLLHGQLDESVPWQRSMRVAECIAGGDVDVILVKDGDHRLSRDRRPGTPVQHVGSFGGARSFNDIAPVGR